MDDALTVLERFVSELHRRASEQPGEGDFLHFAVAKVGVNPLLPRNLFAHAVYAFDESGQAVPPDGSERRPFFFAINKDHPGSVQVGSFLSSVLSTLHRQSMLASVRSGDRKLDSGFAAVVDQLDESARSESERLIRASRAAGDVGPIVDRLLNFGWRLTFRYRQALREALDDIRAAMRFFGDAYNGSQIVRDSIDKVAYATAGAGWHVSAGGGEEVREFLEARLRQARIQQVIAQFTRDANLLGTGCMVFTSASDVAVRLLRPTHIKIEGRAPSSGEGLVTDDATGRSWPLSEVLLGRGVEQEGTPYGCSVLEPAMSHLHTIAELRRAAAQYSEMKRLIEQGKATGPRPAEVQERIDFAERAKADAERRLDQLFWFPEKNLQLDRTDLYLPGQERWSS